MFWLYVAAEGQVLDQRVVCAYPLCLIVFLDSQMQKSEWVWNLIQWCETVLAWQCARVQVLNFHWLVFELRLKGIFFSFFFF